MSTNTKKEALDAQLSSLAERVEKALAVLDPSAFSAARGEFFVIVVGVMDADGTVHRGIVTNLKHEAVPLVCFPPSLGSSTELRAYKKSKDGGIERASPQEEADILKQERTKAGNQATELLKERLSALADFGIFDQNLDKSKLN